MNRWDEHAKCRGMDQRIFFPMREDLRGRGAYSNARSVCDRCPVRVECLDEVMREESGNSLYRYGMRGGLSPRERAALARCAA